MNMIMQISAWARKHTLQIEIRRKTYMMTISFASQNSVSFGSFELVWLFFNNDVFGTCASKTFRTTGAKYTRRFDWAHATLVYFFSVGVFVRFIYNIVTIIVRKKVPLHSF